MNTILQSDIKKELGQNFINYAVGVNGDRAIPDSRTGLKPVHQRIMYIMEDEGNVSSKPHKKCAKIVGSVMGRVHPHGDSSIYEAMVRLAQEWVMRYPLIDWHGNKGTQDGDGAAASRYTECRLAKIAEDGLLSNLKKKNVDWKPNYSEDEEEPVTLPALFPNLLCNPNQGIGVAMACHWLPHNLTEVGNLITKYMDEGTLDFEGMAPDFPTGGIIINGKELKQIYATGKGKVIIRGKYEIETRNKKNLIVFTEVPYTVKIEELLDQINDACVKELITGVDEVRNESNKKGLRIVFELSKDASEGQVLKQIFKETDLQKSLSANQVALVDKTPVLLNWKECIEIYIKHNIDVIKREAEFDLNKTLARLEILGGLLKALEDIDNIIALIKASKSAAAAKENLMSKYSFTEVQAKAIVDMKLGKLAGLERIELQNEYDNLQALKEELESLLSSEVKQKNKLISCLTLFIQKYGDKRKTEVTHIDIKPEEKEIAEVVPEDVVVMLTQNGFIKKIPADSIKVQRKGGKGIKNADDAIMEVISTNTIDTLMLFTNFGKLYKIVVDIIPNGTNISKGVSISTLINLDTGERVMAATSLYRSSQAQFAVFVTEQGMFKKTYLKEYMSGRNSKTGITALKLKEGDKVATITFLNEEEIILISQKGMSIRFSTADIGAVGRIAMGVKGMKLSEDDVVIAALPIHKNTDTVGVFATNGVGKKTSLNEFPLQARGGKGTYVYKPTDSTGVLVGAEMLSDEDNILLVGNFSTICISAKEVPLIGKMAVGNVLIKNNKVLSVTKI